MIKVATIVTSILLAAWCALGQGNDGRPLTLAIPQYPTGAIVLGIGERVVASVSISGDGKVVAVKTNTTRPYFDVVIKDAVAASEFSSTGLPYNIKIIFD